MDSRTTRGDFDGGGGRRAGVEETGGPGTGAAPGDEIGGACGVGVQGSMVVESRSAGMGAAEWVRGADKGQLARWQLDSEEHGQVDAALEA
ncbi:hypothetical protein N7513_003135 [Penicillium frequentans]|nr:hypothetical protein N7513_003135 [Penicillium glabrum]